MSLKDLGNEKFKAGEYAEAEQLYTLAIQNHPTDQILFSNRARTRLRLENWDDAETDARKAIELHGEKNPAALKSYFSLAQALLEKRHTTEAMAAGRMAYKFCLETKDPSTSIVSAFILRAKQAHWKAKETTRLRELNHTLGFVEGLLQQRLESDLDGVEDRFKTGEVGATGRIEEREELEKEAEERRQIVRAAFADPRDKETEERVVPDHLIDSITFEVMHDPVITPSGQSYERVGLLKHIQNTGLDPLTRQPLTEKMLIPNVALRVACSEFLENNGWAVDY